MPDRRRARVAPVRLWRPAPPGTTGDRRRRSRGARVFDRPRGSRDRSRQQAASVRAAGWRSRHVAGESAPWVPHRSTHVRRCGRVPARTWRPVGAPAVQQPGEGTCSCGCRDPRTPRGGTPDRRAHAQRPVLDDEARPPGPSCADGLAADRRRQPAGGHRGAPGDRASHADEAVRRRQVRPDARREDRHVERRLAVDQRRGGTPCLARASRVV